MSTAELRPESRLWLDGDAWSLVELRGDVATIASASRHRTLPIGVLVATARLLEVPEQTDAVVEPVNVALTSLTAAQRANLEDRARVVRALLVEDERPLRERLATTAQVLGVSVRTLGPRTGLIRGCEPLAANT